MSSSGSAGKRDGWLRGFDVDLGTWTKLDKKIGQGEEDAIEAVHFIDGRLYAAGQSASYGASPDAWQLSMTAAGISACGSSPP